MKWTRRVLVVAILLSGPLGLWAMDPVKEYRPLSEADVLKLIELQIEDDSIIARLEKGGGPGFKVDNAVISRLRKAGASEEVLKALRREKTGTEVNLPTDPRKDSIMVWVKPYYPSSYCPLHSEMRVNGHLVNTFSSEAQQAIGKYMKMGWNTITLKTRVKEPAREWNTLIFSIGPTHKKDAKLEMSPVLWTFDNGTDWKVNAGTFRHRSGPSVKEVTLTFHLYFAGLKHEISKIRDGDYVLNARQYYGSTTPPVTSTLFVNGTPMTSFLGNPREQLVIPSLKKGKNEIKLVTRRVDNLLEWNDHRFSLGGPAEWNAAQEKFLMPAVKQFKSDTGWVQDKKSGQWKVESKPGADQYEQVVTFYLDAEPKK